MADHIISFPNQKEPHPPPPHWWTRTIKNFVRESENADRRDEVKLLYSIQLQLKSE